MIEPAGKDGEKMTDGQKTLTQKIAQFKTAQKSTILVEKIAQMALTPRREDAQSPDHMLDGLILAARGVMGLRTCAHKDCGEIAISSCENCDTRFCDEHGTIGGDHDTECGPVAYPSVCWKCGGFNVDADAQIPLAL